MFVNSKMEFELTIQDFQIGDRVKSAPWTDRFMMGDIYGVVAKVGRKHVHVAMSRSGQIVRFAPNRLEHAT